MTKRNILIVTNPENLNNHLNDWIKSANNFSIEFADTDEKAIEMSHVQSYDLVLADDSNTDTDVKKLKAVLPFLQSEIIVLSYNGEATDALHEMVQNAFDVRKSQRIKRYLVLDSSNTYGWNNLPPFSIN
jgi:DNA-binding NtrC family response regulator